MSENTWRWLGDSAEVPGIGFVTTGQVLEIEDPQAVASLLEQGKIMAAEGGPVSAPAEVAVDEAVGAVGAIEAEEDDTAEAEDDAVPPEAEGVTDDGERA